MAACGLDLDWYVPPPPHRGRGAPLGPPLGRASTRTSSGRTGGTPSTEVGLEDCRWTPCYDCGACTGYGIEHVVASRRPARRAAARAPARTSPLAARCPVTLLARRPAGVVRMRQPPPLHQGRQGAVPRPTGTSPGSGSGRCDGPGVPVAYSEGFSPRPRLSFGLALSTGYETLGEYLDIDLADGGRSRRAAGPARVVAAGRDRGPGGHRRSRPAPSRSSRPSRAASWRIEVAGAPTRRPRRRASTRCSTPTVTLPITVERKGTAERRSTPAPPSLGHATATARCSPPSWPPIPAASARRAASEPWTQPGTSAGCCEPTNGRPSTAPAASRSRYRIRPRSARRRPRTPRRVRHEKGSPR